MKFETFRREEGGAAGHLVRQIRNSTCIRVRARLGLELRLGLRLGLNQF